jgi:hypothetical protein
VWCLFGLFWHGKLRSKIYHKASFVVENEIPLSAVCEQIPGVYFEAHRRQNSRSVYYALENNA